MHLVPLVLAIPLTGAAILVLLSRSPGPQIGNAVAVAAAVASTGLCAYVLDLVLRGGMIVYWFGAWRPETHVGIGIDFAVDAAGATCALLASFIATLVIVYSAEYYKDSGPLFNVLLLVFLGAACACFYTGDLFDLFVFFELSNIAMFSLSAYKVRDATALDGALVFVITNSIAAFAILFGLTLLEGYTDQLNLATIGQYLAVHPQQPIAVGALALSTCGFFLRSGLVPFHFWFADAQSSAPSPVCVLFSAVTVEIRLYAFARVFWTVFSGVFHDLHALRIVLISFGSASAIFGAVMSFGAHHLKRLIAYVTIAHMGVALVAVGLLTAQGLAAGLLYAGAFSLAAATLIFSIGAVVHHFGIGDELDLWGRGREIPFVGALFLIGALCAAGLPCVGTFAGRALLFSAASSYAPAWIAAVALFVSALTGGALLKAVGSIWFGLGDPDPELTHAGKSDEQRANEESDQPEESGLGWHLLAPAAAMCAVALGAPLVPRLWRGVQFAANAFVDRGHYYAMTVYGHASPPIAVQPQSLPLSDSALFGLVALVGACALALASLYQRRLRRLHALSVNLAKLMEALERLHDGQIGDYVTWFVLGSALLGGMFFIAYK